MWKGSAPDTIDGKYSDLTHRVPDFIHDPVVSPDLLFRFPYCRPSTQDFPQARFWITSGLPTRTKPLARRTLPRGSTQRVQELLT